MMRMKKMWNSKVKMVLVSYLKKLLNKIKKKKMNRKFKQITLRKQIIKLKPKTNTQRIN